MGLKNQVKISLQYLSNVTIIDHFE